MARRRIKGFLSLNRSAIRSLNHDYGLSVGARFLFLMLVDLVDHQTGQLAVSVRWLSAELRLRRNSLSEWLRELREHHLIDWIGADRKVWEGQVTIPGYDWWTALEDAEPPQGGTQSGTQGGTLGGSKADHLMPPDQQERPPAFQAFQASQASAYLAQSATAPVTKESNQDLARERPLPDLRTITTSRWLCLQALVELGKPSWLSEVQDRVAEIAKGYGLRARRTPTVADALWQLESWDGLATRLRDDVFAARQPAAEQTLADGLAEGWWPNPQYDDAQWDSATGELVGFEGEFE
jgi:hypothetical protein